MLRNLKISGYCVVLFMVVALPFYYLRDNADATGSAFPYTKHGGGTTDGETPCAGGVNRGLGTDYGGNCASATYHDSSVGTLSGTYKSGECNHCHELHSMFGESEPQPISSPIQPYLLFKYPLTPAGGYSELCWYCHDSMSNISSSGSLTGMGRWGFYQGKGVYQSSSHYSPPAGSVYWPGDGSASPIWPRRNRSGLTSGNLGSCLNCHTPHGIKSPNAAGAYDTTSPDGSGGVPAARQTVASGNPSVNADYLIPRQLISWEENLCERCHDAGGPSTRDIQTEINKRLVANQSGHPVDDTALAGRHVASEALPITSKHVECYDCHNPHAVKVGTNTPGDGDGGMVKGMKYVDINGAVQNPAPIGAARQPYIFEICLKCHGNSFDCIMTYKALGASDGTAGCAPLTTRYRGVENGAGFNAQMGASNKRKEFDPNTPFAPGGTNYGVNNTAYHPVASPGRNMSRQLCNQLASAFSLDCTNPTAALSNLTINCTDCHNGNDGDTISSGAITESSLRSTDKPSGYAGPPVIGPHGSTKKRLLRANYPTLIGSGASNSVRVTPVTVDRLCFRCHNPLPFISANGASGEWTNFFVSGPPDEWGGSFHNYHLSQVMTDNIPITCHECHNNTHSNVEANNTQYYDGATCCFGFPPDGNTHLINFAPNVTPDAYAKPAWLFIPAENQHACILRCHGRTMSSCRYGSVGGGGWCA